MLFLQDVEIKNFNTMSDTASLNFRGKTYEFPVIEGTENELAITQGNLWEARVQWTPGIKIPGPVRVESLFSTEKKEC